ncbi:MAG: peptidoglycan-associated lipoprotein [Pseudomonadota bacterium]|jgi:peptidoglycan-associated lipoprotein
MKKILLAISVVVLVSGCSSAVKLDDVRVEDKSGKPILPADGQNPGAAGIKSGVTGVDLDKAGQDAINASGSRIIYFDYDSYVIKPEYQSIIEAHSRAIKADKNRKVAVEGHTDERGGREYNLALGQKRAEAVRKAMGLLGIPDSQIEAVSYGKEKPAAQGSEEAAMARNRRAEISYR